MKLQVFVPPGEYARRHPIESHVRPALVVVGAPSLDDRAGLVKGREPVDVEALVPQ